MPDDPTSSAAPLAPNDPEQVGGYPLVGRLGQGEMGVVYLGKAADGAFIAVKVIRTEFANDRLFTARLRREAGNARRVESPGMARVIDVGVDGGQPYLVTQYVPGSTLEQEVITGKQEPKVFGAAKTKKLALDILGALVAAHEAGVVHGDIEPSNVLLPPDGARIINFGIARALIAYSELTQGGYRVGTFGYMAPEQIRDPQATPQADVFAWGATVTFAANGVGPFRAGDDATLRARTLSEPPALGQLSPALRPAVEKALSSDPRERPTAHELLELLRPTRRRPRWVIAVAGAAVLAVAATLGIVLPIVVSGAPQLGECAQIVISAGQKTGVFYQYGEELKQDIEDKYSGSVATVEETNGGTDNIARLKDPSAATCRLGIVGHGRAVDAKYGVKQFSGDPHDKLRMVGSIWFDLVHLVVRRDSGIDDPIDLCDGGTVATGLERSGTKQVGEDLFQQMGKPDCHPKMEPKSLSDGLAALRESRVDAVLWAGGAPTPAIGKETSSGLAIRLLPLGGYKQAMQDEWNNFYRSLVSPNFNFAQAQAYQMGTTSAKDYPGVDPVSTVAVPNGIAANEQADPDMVRFVAESLDRSKAGYEGRLWGEASDGRHFPGPQAVATNSLYCLVPLHPAAASYYEKMGIRPPCNN